MPGGLRARHLPPSLERLVHLYDAWGKPEQAARWRAMLAIMAEDTPTPATLLRGVEKTVDDRVDE